MKVVFVFVCPQRPLSLRESCRVGLVELINSTTKEDKAGRDVQEEERNHALRATTKKKKKNDASPVSKHHCIRMRAAIAKPHAAMRT